MENNSRQIARKFFFTACLMAAMYYFIMENIRPEVEVDSGHREVMGTSVRIIAVAKRQRQAKRSIDAGFDELARADANAKNDAIDKAIEVMKRKGAIGGMVDYDGNMGCFGKPAVRRGLAPGGPAKNNQWPIDPQDPNTESGEADANLN